MTPADLLRAFETLADAPDGVARLRELVLQLAVRGKLVPQDPSDEPASELLKRIAAEKARLVKAKVIRKPKDLPRVSSEEIAFELPTGWEIVRFGTPFVDVITGPFGSALKKSEYVVGGIPVVNPQHLRAGQIRHSDRTTVGPTTAKRLSHFKLMEHDIVVARRGEMGRCAVACAENAGWICGTGSLILRPTRDLCPDFVALYLRSPATVSTLTGESVGSTMLNLNQRIMTHLAFGLPPLAEQHRIVARVDELMGLLDRLEAARTSRDATRVAMRDGALAALRDAEDAEAVEIAWARVAERMEDLFTDPADVAPLRQTILQLAVRGRLVPQDPSDESANELLNRIAAEKARLVKAGSLRKPKDLPTVAAKEVPFELPAGWEWTRFGHVTDSRLGKMLDKAKNAGPLRPYLRNANLQWFRFELDDLKHLRLRDEELEECSLRVGDLVICEGGEPGRCAVCDESAAGIVFQKALHRARPFANINVWYLAYLLRCDTWSGRLAELFTGATIKHLTGRSLAEFVIPLPPLAEQHRIVARVDELIGFCDALELRLAAVRTSRRGFAAAAVHYLDT